MKTKLFKEKKINSIVSFLIIAVGILLLSISGCISPVPDENEAFNPEITGTQTPERTQLPTVTKPVEIYKGGPISIKGDDDFTAAKGVVRGSGTQADPYIIEGWTIDLSSYGTEYEKYGVITGISISRTTKYFVIRNCRVENAKGYNSGISLGSVSNGKIENCVLRNNSVGISLSGLNNIIISGNTVENNRNDGISGESSYSDSVTISNNIITGNAETGIDFFNLINSYALNNTIRNNQENGIRIKSSSTSTISNNIVQGNKNDGIEVSYGGWEGGDKNIISYNDVSGNGGGISVYGSYDTITHNTVNGNDWGIRLDSIGLTDITAGNNIVSYNTASNNKHAGIYTCTGCTGNTISDNTALSNNAVKEYFDDGNPRYYDIQIDNKLNTLNNNVYGTIYIYKR